MAYENETIKEQVKRLVRPIFNKVLKEKKSNTRRGVTTQIKLLWRPHNYRRQVRFFHTPFYKQTLLRASRGTLPKKITKYRFPVELSLKNYNSKAITRISRVVTIMADKNTITAIYSPKEKERFWYLIELDSINDIDKKIDEKLKDIDASCMEGLREFTRLFGGRIHYDTARWFKNENEIRGEDFIDKIPQDMIIHSTVFKKVYKNGIEFSKPAYIKNYIKNRAVEELSPKIAQEIAQNRGLFNKAIKHIVTSNNVLRGDVSEFNSSLGEYTKQIKLHLEVLKEMKDTMKEIRKPFFARWFNYCRRNKNE